MALAFTLVALSGAARGALGPRYGGDVVIGVRDMPPSIEPGARGVAATLIGGMVHETLVGIDPQGRPVPALVRAWTVAADGREWRLDLAEGTLFHDGRPVTSQEALAAVRRFLRSDSPAAAGLAAALDKEAPASTPDPLHLVLRFAEPRALPLAPLAAPAAAVTGARGAGCGPFVPLAPAPGKRIRLSAFRAHVRGRPYLDAVDVAAAEGPADLETRYWAGTLDVVAMKEGVSALASTLLLVLDPKHAPFERREARATVSGAIDRADIVRRLLPGGDAAPSLLVPGLLAPMIAHAPARGADLRSAARMAVGSDVPALVSQRIVASLGAVGLRVEAQAVAPAQARTAPAAMRLFLWTPEVAEAGLALHELALLAPRVAGAQEALAASVREVDLDRRRALLHRAEAALREENVIIPVAAVPVSFGVRPGLHGLRVDLSGRLILEDAWREP